MTMIIDKILTLFSPPQTGVDAREIIEAEGNFYNDKGALKGCFEEVGNSASITLLSHERCPKFIIKIPRAGMEDWYFVFYKRKVAHHVEKESLTLRVKIADQMRAVISSSKLTLLHVPKKWKLTKGREGVIAEKVDLFSIKQREQFFHKMAPAIRKRYITQVWVLVQKTGHQDIMNNLGLAKIDGVFKLVVYDIEPYGMTISTLEERLPKATDHFLYQSPFTFEEKLEVIKEDRGRRDSNSQLPA